METISLRPIERVLSLVPTIYIKNLLIPKSNPSALFTGASVSLWRSADLRPQSSELEMVIRKLRLVQRLVLRQVRGRAVFTSVSIDCGAASRTPRAGRRPHVECAVEMVEKTALPNKTGALL